MWDTFNGLISKLGWLLDASKDSAMNIRGPFLGLIEDFFYVNTSAAFIQVKPKDAFIDKLVVAMSEAIDSNFYRLETQDLYKGKILHLSNAVAGRVARGQTQPSKTLSLQGQVACQKP